MGGPHKFFVLISFRRRDVFCGSAVSLFDQASVFPCARLAVYYLAFYSVFRSLIKGNLTATTTTTMAAGVSASQFFVHFFASYKRSQNNNVKLRNSAYSIYCTQFFK